MEPDDTQLAKTVFDTLLSEAGKLNLFEFMQLNAAYRGQTQFHQLSDSVKRHLTNAGRLIRR